MTSKDVCQLFRGGLRLDNGRWTTDNGQWTSDVMLFRVSLLIAHRSIRVRLLAIGDFFCLGFREGLRLDNGQRTFFDFSCWLLAIGNGGWFRDFGFWLLAFGV